jgi:hypothetical protein
MRYEILDSAKNLTILKQDLGMLPKPREDWNTIEPVEEGHYIADGVEYVYRQGELVEFVEENNDTLRYCRSVNFSRLRGNKHE